jgi:hypothetical protein
VGVILACLADVYSRRGKTKGSGDSFIISEVSGSVKLALNTLSQLLTDAKSSLSVILLVVKYQIFPFMVVCAWT